MSDIVKEKLNTVMKKVLNPPFKIEEEKVKDYFEALRLGIVEAAIEYENFRTMAEYMSGMVESLQKRIEPDENN